jgi:hypothetical protein
MPKFTYMHSRQVPELRHEAKRFTMQPCYWHHIDPSARNTQTVAGDTRDSLEETNVRTYLHTLSSKANMLPHTWIHTYMHTYMHTFTPWPSKKHLGNTFSSYIRVVQSAYTHDDSGVAHMLRHKKWVSLNRQYCHTLLAMIIKSWWKSVAECKPCKDMNVSEICIKNIGKRRKSRGIRSHDEYRYECACMSKTPEDREHSRDCMSLSIQIRHTYTYPQTHKHTHTRNKCCKHAHA